MAMSPTPQWGATLAEDDQAHLKSLGFTPRVPVHRAAIDFTREDIRAALFDSEYQAPRALRFAVEGAGSSNDIWSLFMLVQAARALWTPHTVFVGEVPLGRWPYANWYLDGLLFTSPLDGASSPVAMRAYIDGIEQVDPMSKTIYVQVDRFLTDAPSDAPLRFGLGAPGQPMS